MHEPSGCVISLTCSFDPTRNKHYYYRGRDCVEQFCKKLSEFAKEIIDHEVEEMTPLNDEKLGLTKNVTYAKKSFVLMKMRKMNLNYIKSEIIVIIQENLEEPLIVFVI